MTYVVCWVFAFAVAPESIADLAPGDPYTATAFVPILGRNLLVTGLSLGGTLTFGVSSVVQLTLNATLLGTTVSLVLADGNVGLILFGTLPHLVFELPGMPLAGGVGIAVPVRFVVYLTSRRRTFVDRTLLFQIVVLSVLSVVCILIGAAVEAFVTPQLLAAYG